MRWLLPGKTWTDVPKRSDVTLKVDRLVAPAFKVRSYAGTGGFYSYEWGRSYEGSAHFEAQTTEWKRHLRYGGEYLLGRAEGEAFIADRSITPILVRHPDYLAIVDGRPSPLYLEKDGKSELNVIAKLNAGNPAAVALFCDWTLRNLREARASRDKASHSVISVEPSDGYGYGTDTKDLPGNGSGSDQSFFIANACARKVRAAYADASVILLAYAGHAAPPSFDVDANVIVQVAPYAFQDTPPEQFIAEWAKKARRLTIYDYWSIPDWTHDEPTFDYTGLAEKLRYWRSSKIEGVNAETTFGLGAMGISHYLAAHLMWDLQQDDHALVDDWFDRAFGPAKAPMQRMMDRWAHSFVLTSFELGDSYRDLQAAARLAQGHPTIVARIDDYVRYVHYLRLRLEIENATDSKVQSQKAVGLAEYLLDINDTEMAHTTRLIDLYARTYPAIYREFDIHAGAKTPGWARVHPLAHADVESLLTEGACLYPPPEFEIKTYSSVLVPIQPAPQPREQATWGVTMPTIGPLSVDLRMPSDLKALPLRISRQVDNEVTIADENGRVVSAFKVKKADEPHAPPAEMDVDLAPGAYKLHFQPDGDRRTGYFSFQTRSDISLTLRDFLSPKPSPSPRLYFYVPAGLRRLALYYPDTDYNNVFRFQVLDPAGNASPITYRDNRRVLLVDVPPGTDGRIWSINRSVSPDVPARMLNAPQAFSLSPELLWTSRDGLASAPSPSGR